MVAQPWKDAGVTMKVHRSGVILNMSVAPAPFHPFLLRILLVNIRTHMQKMSLTSSPVYLLWQLILMELQVIAWIVISEKQKIKIRNTCDFFCVRLSASLGHTLHITVLSSGDSCSDGTWKFFCSYPNLIFAYTYFAYKTHLLTTEIHIHSSTLTFFFVYWKKSGRKVWHETSW